MFMIAIITIFSYLFIIYDRIRSKVTGKERYGVLFYYSNFTEEDYVRHEACFPYANECVTIKNKRNENISN